MDTPDLETRILTHVRADNYRPVKPRVIAKQLRLPEAERADVRKAVKRLVKKGELTYGVNHLVYPAESAPNDLDRIGTFRRTKSGFGFVRTRKRSSTTEPEPDIYVSTRQTMDASNGDIVRVRVRREKGEGPDRRIRGAIIEIIERETHQFVGTYKPGGEIGYVQVDGNVFSHQIPVGDPSAKNVRAGDKVVIEMIRFPSPRREGEGVITEVLGPRGEPGVDTLSIIREYSLPDDFPEEVLESARQQAEQFDPEQRTDRADLTHLTVVTIDPADARDFDDAISLEKLDNGHWRLGVHIADVAHFVPPKSPLDREARERGTSVYLPDQVIPMLPEVISNNLASLQPHQIRFAKTVFLELTPQGVPIHTEITRSAIQSDHRFNYEEVQQYIDDPKPWVKPLSADVYKLLGDMIELARALRQRRLEHGSLELLLPEVKIDLDDDGRVAGAHVVENTESHQIIEEFMLAANEAVAHWLTDHDVLFLRRLHPLPSPTKLRDLTQFVRDLGITCDNLASRFEIKRVLEEVDGRPEQQAVNYAVLRAMQKAVYGPQQEGHYALNKTHYCHFTSPIRRYPDLTIHRLLDAIASGKKPRNNMGELMAMGEHCSDREQRAESAERELIKIKLLAYLSDHIGQKMEAVITGVEEYGLFVQGTELPAEGLVHISSISDDYYHYDATTRSLTGRREDNRFGLGDLVQVEVYHVNLDRRELDFRILQRIRAARSDQSAKHGSKEPASDRKKERGKDGKAKRGKRQRK